MAEPWAPSASLCGLLPSPACVAPSAVTPTVANTWWERAPTMPLVRDRDARGRRFLANCSACAAHPGLKPCSRSVERQEAFVMALVEVLMPVPRPGFFIEVGAHNGMHQSNTMFAHGCKSWRGLLIEANPSAFEQLTARRVGNVVTWRTALCANHTTVHFVSRQGRRDDAKADEMGGVETVLDPLAYRATLTRQKLLPRSTNGSHPWLDAPKGVFHRYPVPCSPLGSMLRLLRATRVDVFWLDVEGSELPALQGFDFDAVSVGVLVVETRANDAHRNRAVRSLLRTNGFEVVRSLPVWGGRIYDTVYVRLEHFWGSGARDGTDVRWASLQSLLAQPLSYRCVKARCAKRAPVFMTYGPGRLGAGRPYVVRGLKEECVAAPHDGHERLC